MNETMMREKIHQAVDNHCAHLRDDYWLAQRVIAMTQEQERNEQPERTPKRRSKLSVALIVAIVLTLMSVTAVAAVVLSAREVVEQELVPMARQNDTEATVEPEFSNDELSHVLEIAQENGMTIPQGLLDIVDAGYGYDEDTTIRTLASQAFGYSYKYWTIEERYWYGEIRVAIGVDDENPHRLPGDGEISLEEALEIAAGIAQAYGSDLHDTEHWRRSIQYACHTDEHGVLSSTPIWELWFEPTSIMYDYYKFTLSPQGEVLTSERVAAPGENTRSGRDMVNQYERVYGLEQDWSVETWAAFGNDLEGKEAGSWDIWIYQHAGFRLPPAGGITQEQAEALAIQAVNMEKTEIYTALCCMDGDTPIWKIETRTKKPENIRSAMYDAIWWFEIDCMTGEIRDAQQAGYGPDAPSIQLRYIPRRVYEELKKQVSEGNG